VPNPQLIDLFFGSNPKNESKEEEPDGSETETSVSQHPTLKAAQSALRENMMPTKDTMPDN